MIERRCTAAAPMPMEQKDAYFWIHADAKEVVPFFNLVAYQCQNCGLTFCARPRDK